MSAPRPRGLPAVPLGRLAVAAGLRADPLWADVPVSGVTLDSRSVEPGDLYAALPGARMHGASFTGEAAEAGAVAVLTDEAGAAAVGLPVLVCEDPRAVLGAVAAEVYGRPADALTMLGVTGTDGKTTLTYLLEAGLAAAGLTTGVVGTVETRLAGEVVPAVRTTPEAPDLHALLAVARQRGVDAVAMEVSSHALAQHRVDGVRYQAGVFTGLSQDHLDFHRTMDAYFGAKARLFEPARCGTAVICLDSDWGHRLVERVRVPLVTYAVGDDRADWTATDLVADARGSTVRAHGPAGEDVALSVGLPGEFNVANALGALATLVAVGLDPDTAARGIGCAAGVPGRLERVEAGQPYAALVDYAHTPDAVARVLAALRPLTPGRLVVVLGAGGDRDPGKRPAMARAAAAGADLAVLTSDNPRSEDPLAILAQMTAGLELDHIVEPDRRAAVARAARGLRAGDTLLVAGRGHETGQESGGVVHPFDDRTVLAEVMTP